MPKLIAFFAFMILPSLLFAQRKHDIILVGKRNTGSFFFANEFTKRWNAKHSVSILTDVEPLIQRRLQRLETGQGKLAIIGAKGAFEMLSKYPTLAVVTPLWKNRLYVLGRSNSIPTNVYFHHNASDFFQTKANFLQKAFSQVVWQPFQASRLPNLLKNLGQKEILVFYAPDRMLEQYSHLRQIEFSPSVLRAYQKKRPWVFYESQPKTVLKKTSMMLFQYPFLVIRRDAPNKQVIQILKLLYNKNLLEQLPLHQELSLKTYKTLLKEYRIHIAAQGFFSNLFKAKS